MYYLIVGNIPKKVNIELFIWIMDISKGKMAIENRG